MRIFVFRKWKWNGNFDRENFFLNFFRCRRRSRPWGSCKLFSLFWTKLSRSKFSFERIRASRWLCKQLFCKHSHSTGAEAEVHTENGLTYSGKKKYFRSLKTNSQRWDLQQTGNAEGSSIDSLGFWTCLDSSRQQKSRCLSEVWSMSASRMAYNWEKMPHIEIMLPYKLSSCFGT